MSEANHAFDARLQAAGALAAEVLVATERWHEKQRCLKKVADLAELVAEKKRKRAVAEEVASLMKKRWI